MILQMVPLRGKKIIDKLQAEDFSRKSMERVKMKLNLRSSLVQIQNTDQR